MIQKLAVTKDHPNINQATFSNQREPFNSLQVPRLLDSSSEDCLLDLNNPYAVCWLDSCSASASLTDLNPVSENSLETEDQELVKRNGWSTGAEISSAAFKAAALMTALSAAGVIGMLSIFDVVRPYAIKEQLYPLMRPVTVLFLEGFLYSMVLMGVTILSYAFCEVVSRTGSEEKQVKTS